MTLQMPSQIGGRRGPPALQTECSSMQFSR
jgi:hypothetical protein